MNNAPPLYVDKLAEDRSNEIVRAVTEVLYNHHPEGFEGLSVAEIVAEAHKVPYIGDGSLLRPFRNVDEARKVQMPGQSIIIAGYATISAAPVNNGT